MPAGAMSTMASNDQISIVTTSRRILFFSLKTRCSIQQLSISGPGIVAVCAVFILSITGLTGVL